MNGAEFRALMRQHAGGVALICAGSVGNRLGLTATALCSLSDDPPSILVCVNKSASAHGAIVATDKFSVNFLGAHHRDLAAVFSGQYGLHGEERFTAEGYAWSAHASGTPRLEGALAHMECSVLEKRDFASHTIFIGVVTECGIDESQTPLVYFRGKFACLDEL